MRVNQISLVDFAGAPDTQFVVPVYQRVYAWTRPQLREFWDDLMQAGREMRPHFMGNVFFSETVRQEKARQEDGSDGTEGQACQKSRPFDTGKGAGLRQLDLIDGQQRTTTFTLLMCALCSHLRETGGTFDGMDADAVAAKFLKVATPDGDACKLVLSRADAPTLRWVEGIGERPATEEEYSKLVVDSLDWFVARMNAEGFDYEAFECGVSQLYIVEVLMEATDRPQTVFESLNAKGLPLSTPDLVRNFLLMRREFDNRSYLYDAYWAKVEDAFAGDADDRYLSHAIRLWTGGGANIQDDRGIFDAFKVAFSAKGAAELEKRTAGLADYCIAFHEKVAAGDEATIKACREWEESRGKAERLRNDRKIFGD